MSEFLFARRRMLFFFALVLGSVVLRWPALDRQIWNLDEGSTTTMAELILHGQIPFRDAADNRTPLVPYLKAVILAVAGEWNMHAIHVTVALMIGLTATLLWQLGRRLGQETAGVLAALCFFWLSGGLIPPVDGLTAHTGWFVAFFSTLGFWLFAGAFTRVSRRAAFASGLAFGFSYLAKQPGLLDFGVCLVIVGLALLRRDPAQAWRLLPPLVLGFLIPVAGTIAYFAAHGALDDLIFYSWTYNTKYYVPEVPQAQRLMGVAIPFRLLSERMPVALGLVALAWPALAIVAFWRLVKRPPLATLEWLILGWSATGLLSTMLSGRDFSHYSIQVVPGVSLACGWALATVARPALAWWQNGRKVRSALVFAAVTGVLLSFAIPTVHWIRTVEAHDDANNPIIGKVIQEHSRPDERLFIWGYMPEMHVFARRLPSTRFFYTNWVTGLIPWTNVDWFIDTTYAVIPGTPEQLQADFVRRPPTLILDTGRLRGYLKYPLREQTWLWSQIPRDFAEVDADVVGAVGFTLYQRVLPVPTPASFPAGARSDARVSVAAASSPDGVAVTAAFPAGTETLELYVDHQLYRRLACPPQRAGQAIFTVLLDSPKSPARSAQVLARGRDLLASAIVTLPTESSTPAIPGGPRLAFGGREFPPLASYNGDGPVGPASNGWWKAYAPAKFAYERPPGVFGVEVEYQLSEILWRQADKWWTDGLDFAIEFVSHTGKRTLYGRRHLDARFSPADRGVQKASVQLPLDEPGQIIVWFSPGAKSDSSSDWAQIKSVRGTGAPLGLLFRGQSVPANRITTPFDISSYREEETNVVMTHAPSAIEIPLLPTMYRVSGAFGLLPAAWNGPEGSAGAMFEVWYVPTDGAPRKLHSQLVDPGHEKTHRGLQRFAVTLPQPASGVLRLVTQPAHPGQNSFNYTYWGDLVAKGFPAVLNTPGEPITCTEIESRFGYDELGEDGRTVTFAHAPSRIVFPLPPGFTRLRGEFGLVASAYSGDVATDGASFIVEYEDAAGHRTTLWQRDLAPQEVTTDRGFISFRVDLPKAAAPGQLILRTDARAGHSYTRAWTFWHDLQLDP